MRMRRKKNLVPRMERCAQWLISDPQALRGNWRSLLPGAKELRIELGCGKGRFTCQTAAAAPEVLFVAVERVAEDFFLPSPTGQGMPLTREELRQRLEERAPSVFFSSELCAHYFTYMSRQNGAHFVLFDDAGSIRKKLQVARNLGISSAVLAYPQVDDLLLRVLLHKGVHLIVDVHKQIAGRKLDKILIDFQQIENLLKFVLAHRMTNKILYQISTVPSKTKAAGPSI